MEEEEVVALLKRKREAADPFCHITRLTGDTEVLACLRRTCRHNKEYCDRRYTTLIKEPEFLAAVGSVIDLFKRECVRPRPPLVEEYVVPWAGYAILFEGRDTRGLPEPSSFCRDEEFFLFSWCDQLHCVLLPWKSVCIYDYREGSEKAYHYYEGKYGEGIDMLISLVMSCK
jgi:hypothetical protein